MHNGSALQTYMQHVPHCIGSSHTTACYCICLWQRDMLQGIHHNTMAYVLKLAEVLCGHWVYMHNTEAQFYNHSTCRPMLGAS